MDNNTININININPDEIISVLEKVKKLENNDQVFKMLSQVATPKQELKDALEIIEDAERKIKRAISDRAGKLYGKDWQAIAGNGYKIGRQMSGSVYELENDAEVPDEFKKVAISLDSDIVTSYVKANGKLPDGIVVNPNRQEVIRLTVKPKG
jgi:hypothetical protein